MTKNRTTTVYALYARSHQEYELLRMYSSKKYALRVLSRLKRMLSYKYASEGHTSWSRTRGELTTWLRLFKYIDTCLEGFPTAGTYYWVEPREVKGSYVRTKRHAR